MEAHEPSGLVTPVTILAETMSFIRVRFGIEFQRRFWDAFMDSGIELAQVDDRVLHMARDIEERYSDCAFGFADCTLLATCETLKTARILSLDRRLSAYRPSFAGGVEVLP